MEQRTTIGNYRLLEPISSGTYGRVYRAEHLVLSNRIVAIKILHGALIQTQSDKESFFREAKLLEMLQPTTWSASKKRSLPTNIPLILSSIMGLNAPLPWHLNHNTTASPDKISQYI